MINIDLYSQKYNKLFESANHYKKIAEVKGHKVLNEEIVKTIIKHQDGVQFIETTNTAKPGDYIVENPGGEKYVVSSENFDKNYKEIAPGIFHETKTVKAFQIDTDINIATKWGTELILSGGWLIDADGIRYGVDREAFEQTYKKV